LVLCLETGGEVERGLTTEPRGWNVGKREGGKGLVSSVENIKLAASERDGA